MAKRIRSTPRKDGFRMPGEFEPQEKIWMIWPERQDTWRDGAKPAQKAFVEVARAISAFEPVTMLVSAAQYANARNQLPDEVRVVEMSTDDAWCRDCGPTFLKNDKGEVRGVDWEFNAWGGLVDGCYFPWASDNARFARSRASTATTPPASCWRAAPSMWTGRAPCSPPRCACSARGATPT